MGREVTDRLRRFPEGVAHFKWARAHPPANLQFEDPGARAPHHDCRRSTIKLPCVGREPHRVPFVRALAGAETNRPN